MSDTTSGPPASNTLGLSIGLGGAAVILGLVLMIVIVAIILLVMFKKYRGGYPVSQTTGDKFHAAHVMSYTRELVNVSLSTVKT